MVIHTTKSVRFVYGTALHHGIALLVADTVNLFVYILTLSLQTPHICVRVLHDSIYYLYLRATLELIDSVCQAYVMTWVCADYINS